MGTVTVRKYKYTLQSAPSRSSGTIMTVPAYGYFFPGTLCQYYSRTSMSRMPLGSGGPTVAYREVEVWHGASAEFGKTRHLFRSTLTAGAADALPGSSAWPYSRVTSMEFKRGQQTAATEYNTAGLALLSKAPPNYQQCSSS